MCNVHINPNSEKIRYCWKEGRETKIREGTVTKKQTKPKSFKYNRQGILQGIRL